MIEAPNFIPLPENINELPNMRNESREVPPPANEAGFAETHHDLTVVVSSRTDQAWTLM